MDDATQRTFARLIDDIEAPLRAQITLLRARVKELEEALRTQRMIWLGAMAEVRASWWATRDPVKQINDVLGEPR